MLHLLQQCNIIQCVWKRNMKNLLKIISHRKRNIWTIFNKISIITERKVSISITVIQMISRSSDENLIGKCSYNKDSADSSWIVYITLNIFKAFLPGPFKADRNLDRYRRRVERSATSPRQMVSCSWSNLLPWDLVFICLGMVGGRGVSND